MRPFVLPLLLVGCINGAHDPNRTGLVISPAPGRVEGPVDLIIVNRTGGDLTCTGFETNDCAALSDPPAEIPERERWIREDITCIDIDIICFDSDATGADLPIRSWRWFVEEPEDS